MKFSMIFEAQVEYGTPDVERQAIRNCVEQAVFAEEMGFDGIWAVEHHSLVEYSHMSAPEIFLTAVAAKTSRIRVGHAAVCMPFGYNHPARVAERAAMLDIISDGRLNLGAARGGTAQEMSLCGVDPELTAPQVEEALRFIGHCWREDTIEWDSDLLTIQHAARAPTAHASCPARCSSPTRRCSSRAPTRRRCGGRRVRRRPDGARLRRPRGDRRHAPHVRRGAGARATPRRWCRPGRSTTSSSRCARRSSWTTATRRSARAAARCASSPRRSRHWAAPNGVAPARGTEQRRQRRRSWHEHLQTATGRHRPR